jgi:hypothetical protein
MAIVTFVLVVLLSE